MATLEYKMMERVDFIWFLYPALFFFVGHYRLQSSFAFN